MKRVVALTILSFVAFAVGLAPISNTYANPTGRTFRVAVRNIFGVTATDCYRFDFPNPGDLTIDLLFQTITYSHGQLDDPDASSRFKAVSRSGQLASIMFFGEEIQALEQLTGEGVQALDRESNSFVFAGQETGPSTSPSLCVAVPPSPPGTSSAKSSTDETYSTSYPYAR